MPPTPGWYWDHFLSPPFNPETGSYGRCSNTKLRTYCLKCLEGDIESAGKADEELVRSGQLQQGRSRAEIQHILLSTAEANRRWTRARVETMINHLIGCPLQEPEVINQARLEKASAGQKKAQGMVDIPGYGIGVGVATSPKASRRFPPSGAVFGVGHPDPHSIAQTQSPSQAHQPHAQHHYQPSSIFPQSAGPSVASSAGAGPSTSAFRVTPQVSAGPSSTSHHQTHPFHNIPASAMSNEIRGRLVLITGGTGGIGRATAVVLAKAGCHIALHYHHAASKASDIVNDLTASYGVRCQAYQADLGDYDSVRKLHADVVATLGHPDILYNNSGIVHRTIGFQGSIEEVSIEMFEETWRINNASHFLLTQLCLPHMLQQHYGRIVFCSSVAAHTGGVVGPHYASSKSAMHGLVHWIATRYSKEGITCNAVAPALITETNMLPDEPPSYIDKIPVGRLGRPQEIASIVEMLVRNSYMTNKIIVADGGWTSSAF